MPRRVDVDTREIGRVKLYLIYETKGVWEERWRPLQGHPSTGSFTSMTKEVMDHAFHGWTEPFIKALGPPPEGAIRKLPASAKQCAVRGKCPFYIKKNCAPTSKTMPWCYQPEGLEEGLRPLLTEVIELWRQGVYVTVIREET